MVGCRDEAKRGRRSGAREAAGYTRTARGGLEILPNPRDEIRKLASKIRIKETEQKRRRRSASITVLFGQLLRAEILKYELIAGWRATFIPRHLPSRDSAANLVRCLDVNQLSRFQRRYKMADVT